MSLILCSCPVAVAQDEMERYRLEAVQRLEAEIGQLEAEQSGAQTLAGLAHTRFFLGTVTPDQNSALSHFQAGLSDAGKALRIQADNRSAQLWSVTNTLQIFKIKKPLRALWSMDDLEAQLHELKRNDRNFAHAAPDRVLAVLYAQAPEWLLGSPEKAERHFMAALELAPDFPANTLLFAEFLLDQGRKKQARAVMSSWSTRGGLVDFPLYEMIWLMDILRIEQRLAE